MMAPVSWSMRFPSLVVVGLVLLFPCQTASGFIQGVPVPQQQHQQQHQPQRRGKESVWGYYTTASLSSSLSSESFDEDLSGVNVVELLGLKRVNRMIAKSERRRTSLASSPTNDDEETSSTSSSSSSGLKLIIAGAPASGKGTQCESIKENYNVVHLSTGDMLRQAVADQTEVGTLAKEYMDAGKLVPDDVIIGVVKDRLEQTDCQTRGWLLDGFPRTRAQADAMATSGITADCFLFLNVPDDVLVERVVGRRTDPETGKIYHLTFSPPPADDKELWDRLVHRTDDTEEKVKVRLEQFHANVAAVKDSFADISVEIDGTGKPDVVASAIGEAIREKCGL